MVTGALESHFSGARKNLQFVHLSERLKKGKHRIKYDPCRLLSNLCYPKRECKAASDRVYT